MGNAAGVRRDFEGLERRRMEAAQLLKQGGPKHFVANHRNHGVIGGPLASGTMVVNVVAEAHELS